MKKELKDLMKNYIEEKIQLSEFIEIITNANFSSILTKNKKLKPILDRAIELKKEYVLQSEIALYYYVKQFFRKSNHICEAEKKYNFLIDSLPDWFDGYNIDYLYKIFKSINLPLNDIHIKDIYQQEISKKFRYEKYPPVFLTSFDWPMNDDEPLFFKEMKEEINGSLITDTYVFFDEKTNKDVIITQSDYR